MAQVNRRTFLKGSLAAAATVILPGPRFSARAYAVNNTVRVGVAGFHGRGGSHMSAYLGMKSDGVDLCWLIDVDRKVLEGGVAKVEKARGSKPKFAQDIRKALEDKELDAISIATPNHWHALMTIWAVQAGKDVYVEKPCSHNLFEGRIASDIIAKSKQIVQTGTQSRSSASWAKMIEITKSGKLGKLLFSHGFASKTRSSIGVKEVENPPAELDYDLWLGPAPKTAFHKNLVHYNWHWFWDFGNGEIGNQGVHQTDICRWAIPGSTHPTTAFSIGGRFGYKDQAQTPNTQLTVFDYGETIAVFEVCGLVGGKGKGPASKSAEEAEAKGEADTGSKAPGEGKTSRVSNDFVYEAGTVVGGSTFYPKGSTKPGEMPKVDVKLGPGSGPFGNFIAACRTRKTADLNAPYLEGHYSASICHLGNISWRLGKDVAWKDVAKAPFGKNDYANAAWDRLQEHLAKNRGLKLDEMQCRVGKALQFDPKTEKFVNDAEADALLTRPPRKPFDVPEKVV